VDLIVDAAGTMWLIYRLSVVSQDTVKAISSTDGITWSAPIDLMTGSQDAFLSPSVIWNDTLFVMYYVDMLTTPNTLRRKTCATIDGTWSASEECTITGMPGGKEAWHLDVIKRAYRYDLFLMVDNLGGTGAGGALYFGTSSDGIAFTLANSALLSPSASGWDNGNIYRASPVFSAAGYDLFYGGVSSGDVWKIGRTTVTLS
jgi:hypothetical protein